MSFTAFFSLFSIACWDSSINFLIFSLVSFFDKSIFLSISDFALLNIEIASILLLVIFASYSSKIDCASIFSCSASLKSLDILSFLSSTVVLNCGIAIFHINIYKIPKVTINQKI